MSDFLQFHLDLTPKQINMLHKNKTIQIKPAQLSTGSTIIMVNPKHHKKLASHAYRKKGIRLHLTPEELSKTKEVEGGKISLKSIGKAIVKGAKKGADFYKQHLRDTEVGKLVRQGAKKAIEFGATTIPSMVGLPEATPYTSKLADNYGDKLIKKAGLGVGGSILPKRNMQKSNTANQLLEYDHPAMHPVLPYRGITDIPRSTVYYPNDKYVIVNDRLPVYGGSFRLAGYGSPLQPVLPHSGYFIQPQHLAEYSGFFNA